MRSRRPATEARRAGALLVCAALLAAGCSIARQPGPVARQALSNVPVSAASGSGSSHDAPVGASARGGADRATTHRRFADVEHWKRVFDDPGRDAWQKPREVVSRLSLHPGDAVADVGAGTGYFLPALSRAVGPSGTVFAVEVEPALTEYLRDRSDREGLANVVPVLASYDNPRLPRRSLDAALIVDTYHHIDARRTYFRRFAELLKPGGRVAVVDWKQGDLPVGPPPRHRVPAEQVIGEMQAAGYHLTQRPEILPYQYFLIFEPAGRAHRPRALRHR